MIIMITTIVINDNNNNDNNNNNNINIYIYTCTRTHTHIYIIHKTYIKHSTYQSISATYTQLYCVLSFMMCSTQDCYLLDSCTTQITSVCGSSVYLKISSATSVPGGTYLLADGHTSITYSPSSCDYDDCAGPSQDKS